MLLKINDGRRTDPSDVPDLAVNLWEDGICDDSYDRPLLRHVASEVIEWCEQHLQSYYTFHIEVEREYGTEAVYDYIAFMTDHDYILFKLRWL